MSMVRKPFSGVVETTQELERSVWEPKYLIGPMRPLGGRLLV